jgi:hypothetical protein
MVAGALRGEKVTVRGIWRSVRTHRAILVEEGLGFPKARSFGVRGKLERG